MQDIASLTVTAKGQITLRKDILAHLGIHPGDRIVVEKCPNGQITLRADRPTGQIADVFGFLKQENGPRLTIGEIDELAAEAWQGKR